jgi:hypothetical protein
MNIRNMILVPTALALWACVVQAAAPSAAWTVRQNFPVNRDCRINASAADAAGNLYLAGSIENGANEDYYICKIDGATDSVVWSAVYNGPDDDVDQATGCSLDSSGSLYVTGFSHNGTDFDALTIKYDAATGAQGWVRRYNTGVDINEYASSCAADRFGNVYITGTCNQDEIFSPGYKEDYHAFVLKYNGATGDTVWSRYLYDLSDSLSEANDCCVDDSGNVYIVGYVSPDGDVLHSLAIKLQAVNGDTAWVRRYAPTNTESANNCCLDAAGNLIAVGTRGVFYNPDTIRVIRYNSANGDTIWGKSFPANHNLPQDCAMAGDSALLVSAIRSDYGWWSDQYTIYKFAIDAGDTMWSRSFPIGTENQMLPLAVRDSGFFYVASSNGMRNSNVPELAFDGIYTARHSLSTGDLIDSVSRGQSSSGGWNFAYDCAVSGSNGPIVVGSAETFYAVVLHDPSDGHIVWEKRDPDGYDPPHTRNSRATGVAQAGGSVYTTGNIGTTGLLTYKFDIATGDTLWTAHNSYGFSYATGGDCVPDQWGNLFVAGYDGVDYWENGPIVIKYGQASGDTAWTGRRVPELYSTSSCTVDSTGAFYLLGLGSYGDNIIKYNNSTGDTVWTRPGLLGAEPRGISCGNGSVYVAGTALLDYSLARCSILDGDSLWTRRFDSPYHLYDRAMSCAVDDSGFVYLTGSSFNGTDFDIWTLKCTPDGDTLWSVRYNGPDGKNDFGRGCCVDSLGYLYVTGFSATGRGYDMVTIKYNTNYTGVAGGPVAPQGGRYFLGGVYPNPSPGGKVSLRYELSSAGRVAFAVYNIAGQLVRNLDQGKQPAGIHQIAWDGTDRQGARVASGVYLLRCKLGGLSATRKVLVVR